MSPNLQVPQTSAGQWAISARGFQDLISNKLLVLVDARTVYSPLFAGVFWDANDLVLDDVDRIEVISGPGGTLWGANVRLYALADERPGTRLPGGAEQQDASQRAQAGFRGDWSLGAAALTVQGQVYRAGDPPANALAPLLQGGHLSATLRSSFADGSPYTVQAHFDRAKRGQPPRTSRARGWMRGRSGRRAAATTSARAARWM